MPSRVIKGEINASDSLSRVSIEADLTFRALLVACDDYGRFDGRLGVLKATLFPLRDEMTPERIDRAIGELVRAGCVTRYVSDGRPYLAMPNWEKHRAKGRRGNASRYPDPAGASSEILGSACASEELHDRVGGRGTRDEGRGARDVESDAEPPDAAPVDPVSAKFADDFLAALKRVHAGLKPPSPAAFAKWQTAARLCIAERGHEHARETARWLFDTGAADPDAEFWRGVVLSLPKFREKFDHLAAKRRAKTQGAVHVRTQGNHTSDLAERARAIVRAGHLRPAGTDAGG